MVSVVLAVSRPLPAGAVDDPKGITHAKLALGVHHLTVRQADPHNVFNVAVIDPGAPVEFRAAVVRSDTGAPTPATVSELCRRWNCLVGVNGDLSGSRGQPLGAVVSDGQALVPMPVSPVPAHWQLNLAPSGRFSVDLAPPPGTRQSTGSSYPLLVDGRPQPIAERSSFTLHPHPRTIIGWNRLGQTIIVTVDGRSNRSRGLTLAEAASVMEALGATDAVNLDGGGSTTFVVNGVVVNRPSDGRERPVANAWLVLPKPSSPRSDQHEVVVVTGSSQLPALTARPEPALPAKALWTAIALLLMVAVLQVHHVRPRCDRRSSRSPLEASDSTGGRRAF